MTLEEVQEVIGTEGMERSRELYMAAYSGILISWIWTNTAGNDRTEQDAAERLERLAIVHHLVAQNEAAALEARRRAAELERVARNLGKRL